MSLKQKIEADIKTAMLAKEKDKLRALRAIKSLILLEETKEGAGTELSEEEEIKILSKAAKQRKDSIDVFQKQNREDLAEKEQSELDVIELYLPQQLSDDELNQKIKMIIEETGASSMKDMGKVMGIASKSLAGQADGKRISGIVKSLLG